MSINLETGFLMETDLFQWPDWRQILAKYDCTPELNYYLWNKPPELVEDVPAPIIPVVDVAPPIDTPLAPIVEVPPIYVPPIVATPVPELSTWTMLLMGLAICALSRWILKPILTKTTH